MKKLFIPIITTIAILTGQPGSAAPAPPSSPAAIVSTAQFTAFEGLYEMAPEFKIKVWQDGGHYMAQATGQPSFEIFATAHDTFVAKVAPVKFVFKKDASGKVTHFVMHQGGQEQIAKKTS